MNLDKPTKENLKIILEKLADHLKVANRGLMDPKDYNLDKYDELKFMYEVIVRKGSLSALETQAFLEELRTVRN